ncbi:MAG: DNA polymerase III subunit gamma/tau [Candidatus Dojkabacteria bacterium]
MSQALYRKYRSQTFDELIGQSHITKILKNAAKKGAFSHAYLFVGSRGTGKTSAARILAKATNCTNLSAEGNPCGECNACFSIAKGNFLDLIEIDAASNRGVDQIRELKEKIEFSPVEGKYKVYIVDEVHMLTNEAFNALLKTLEEPPAHVIFILATTDVHKLPATILSRCQRYDFRLGTDDEIRQLLETTAKVENVKLTKEAIEILVQNAHGSYRDSLSLLDVVVSGQLESDNPDEVSESEVRRILGIPDSTMVLYMLEKLVNNELPDLLKLISELENKGVNLQQFVKYVMETLRQLLVGRVAGTIDYSLYPFAQKLNERELLRYITAFLEAERTLKNIYMPGLVLEMLVVQLCTGINSVNEKQATPNGANGNGQNDNSPKKVSKLPEAPKTNKSEANKSEEKSEKPVVETVENIADETVAEETASQEIAEVTEVVSEEAAPVEETITENSSKSGEVKHAPAELSMKDIEKEWDKFVSQIQKFNAHLYAFIKSALLLEVTSKEVTIGVPFEFHKERIESLKSREIMNQIFNEVYGFIVPVKCKVDATVKRKKKVSADVVLKNIVQSKTEQAPKAAESKPTESNTSGDNAQKGNLGATFPRKISKQVEAIFEGM